MSAPQSGVVARRRDEALARSAAYRLLAELALHPASWDDSPQRGGPVDSRSVREALLGAVAAGGYPAAVLRSVAALDDLFVRTPRDALAEDYVRIFGHTLSRECPPYETQYGMAHIFEQTQTLADLTGFYHAFGLQVRPGAGERADHLGIELEFMHVLTYKEAYALEHHGADPATRCREGQQAFARDHLGAWVEDFALRLARCAGSGPYRRYADTLRQYVQAELAYLTVVPAATKTLEPRLDRPEPPCALGCGTVCEPGQTGA